MEFHDQCNSIENQPISFRFSRRGEKIADFFQIFFEKSFVIIKRCLPLHSPNAGKCSLKDWEAKKVAQKIRNRYLLTLRNFRGVNGFVI